MILVPYHQDQPLPAGQIPAPSSCEVVTLPPVAGDQWQRLTALHNAVADAVAATPAPVVLSGDCLVALGVVAGLQRAGHDPAMIWFDAHGDLHTLESSTSGYLGGMALRFILGAHPALVAGPLGLRPLPEHRALLVDARDLDPAEATYLATSAIRHTTIPALTTDALPEGPLVLYIDCDIIDPAELPGLLFPAPNGPSASAVIEAARQIMSTGRVAALDIACPWHPTDDTADRATLLAALTGR
jgi:arginase